MKKWLQGMNDVALRGMVTMQSGIVTMQSVTTRRKGQGMVEYGLIIALVAIVLVVALTALNGGLKNTFNKITGSL